MTVGHGENDVLKRLNAAWSPHHGHAFRFEQRKRSPPVISDIVLGIRGDKTYSIEVKWINVRRKNGKFPKPKPLNFNDMFTFSEGRAEFPHQLTRQVNLCERLGWEPYVLVIVNWYRSRRETEEYLIPSCTLHDRMLAGDASVRYEQMKELHCESQWNYLTGGN